MFLCRTNPLSMGQRPHWSALAERAAIFVRNLLVDNKRYYHNIFSVHVFKLLFAGAGNGS